MADSALSTGVRLDDLSEYLPSLAIFNVSVGENYDNLSSINYKGFSDEWETKKTEYIITPLPLN